jgi:hypothetical protein
MRFTASCSRRVLRSAGAVITAAMLAASVACGDVTDTLLEATDPDLINPDDVQSREGALALAFGTLDRFNEATAGDESTWLFGGLLADEWSTSSTFVQNDETDQRAIQENNSQITDMFRMLARVRTSANQAIAGIREFAEDETTLLAEMYFARGFAELQLASDFCNGIPLSDASGEEPVFGDPLPVDEVFAIAVASFDSALAIVGTSTDADAVEIRRAALVGKARALVGRDMVAEAAALVPPSAVPTSFAYIHEFDVNANTNTIWGQGLSAKRYSVADSVEGNGRNIVVGNAIPFGSADDPRLPVVDTRRAGQDGQTFTRTTTLYDRFTPVDVANGIDARLIEAEAELRAGDPAGMLAILNALRANPPQLGEVEPDAMSPLTDPGTPDGRLDLLFREKAFWTFSRGQRLGDMRRLVRQYDRAPDDVFPVGVHYKGGTYGDDVNLPVVTDERNNPNFQGCTDRNA